MSRGCLVRLIHATFRCPEHFTYPVLSSSWRHEHVLPVTKSGASVFRLGVCAGSAMRLNEARLTPLASMCMNHAHDTIEYNLPTRVEERVGAISAHIKRLAHSCMATLNPN